MRTLWIHFVLIVGLFLITTPCIARPLDRNAFIEVNKKISLSVVRIHVKGARINPMTNEGLRGSGTGFIITEGRVITNNHVVARATDITVELFDGRVISAELLGGDETVDLAVLKLKQPFDITTLTPATLGDSSTIEVGTIIAAIGNALDLGISMTTGIVSARGRVHEQINSLDLIQIDAAINHGNSGGPLVDLDGHVVGVNSAIISGSAITGIGFAIPINYVKDVLPQLSEGKKVGTGWIGAAVTKPYGEDFEAFGIPSGLRGVIVTQIAPGSPAETAGVLRNDFVTRINKSSIANQQDFQWIIRNAKDKVSITLWRLGKELTLEVAVVPDPKPDASAVPPKTGPRR
ncbi:MAG: trypsin-like peptidase domain-containing protein [bacterium]|nr:trypsin-like peptidase domain-containing protein [bacterium]